MMTQKSLFNMSNEQKPWLFRVYRGWNPTHLCGDYFRSHEIGGETILPCASAVVVLWFMLVLFTYMYTIPCRALRISETILCLRGTAPTQCVRHDRWFQMYFMFTPAWWNDPIWQTYFLKRMAQPPTKRDMLVSRRLYNLSCSKKTWICVYIYMYIYTDKNIYYMHRIYNMYILYIYT